jgi:RNA polymerase sigma factor (TIGR02999 family)
MAKEPRDVPVKVTDWLNAWSLGDREAEERLYAELYHELRRQAARCLRRERRGHSLQPTGLVHEAYLRLATLRQPEWASRGHFFAMAARIMRHILVDHARRRGARKRDGSHLRVTLGEDTALVSGPSVDLIALEHALDELAVLDPPQARVVELRYFGDLNVEETAEALGISTATVKREWRTARAWLLWRLTSGRSPLRPDAPSLGASPSPER